MLSDSQFRMLLAVASSARSLEEPGSAGDLEPIVAAVNSMGPSSRDTLDRVAAGSCSLAELRGIKDRAKTLLANAASVDEKNAAALLYNVAVAAAHAYHSTNISSRPLEEQLGVFEKLARVFDGQPLGRIFRTAAAGR